MRVERCERERKEELISVARDLAIEDRAHRVDQRSDIGPLPAVDALLSYVHMDAPNDTSDFQSTIDFQNEVEVVNHVRCVVQQREYEASPAFFNRHWQLIVYRRVRIAEELTSDIPGVRVCRIKQVPILEALACQC